MVEFAYLGAAEPSRPDSASSDGPAQFFATVYLRDNPAGVHRELWYHGQGCRRWLRVVRDTRDHRILGAEFAFRASGT